MTDPRDDLARLAPWVPAICDAADEFGVRRSVLAAMCLRESLAGWAPGYTRKGTHLGWGDAGHAFGLWQCDRRFWEQVLRGMWPGHQLLTPLGQARAAAATVAGARRFLEARHPGVAFLHERAALSAYNAALHRVDAQLEAGMDPDAVTTGSDYGKDVLARAAVLERRDPIAFPPAAG
ncbi:MAG TPA: hypothetical protein VLS93_09700 [Anaeromyxobacteraceae bacterium]|nr:hypothetical protein [Anaeromyxobacteraceae bacterium]